MIIIDIMARHFGATSTHPVVVLVIKVELTAIKLHAQEDGSETVKVEIASTLTK